MLSNDFMLEKVKILLNIDDTDLYDERLDLLIGGAVSKLATEGIPNGDLFNDEDNEHPLSNLSKDYLICIAYQVGLDLNLDIDLQTFYVQYMTRVGTLRCNVSLLQP